ncbi:MAG: hypothetical protein ABWZ74_00860 [Hyphomicrobiaceae bacterium]|jgi:hypothetical protein
MQHRSDNGAVAGRTADCSPIGGRTSGMGFYDMAKDGNAPIMIDAIASLSAIGDEIIRPGPPRAADRRPKTFRTSLN